MNFIIKIIAWLITVTIAGVTFPVAANADTDGTEIQIAGQPGRLILQLGPQWAGMEFELKTDDGVYPVPVVVDSTGILKMDLGGSKTYTLSCLASNDTTPGSDISTEPQSQLSSSTIITENDSSVENSGEIKSDMTMIGIPVKFLVMFISGLIIATVGLVELLYSKRKKKAYDDDDDDYV